MVTLISSIHQAVETKVKTNFMGQPVIKPYVVHDYNIKMGGVDLSDNFLSHYQTLKSIKWYRKLLLHLINMAKCTYIEQKVWCTKNVSLCIQKIHCQISNYNIRRICNLFEKEPSIEIDNSHLRLAGKHFVRKFETVPGSKRKMPARKCSVCNFTCQQLARMGHNDLNLQVRYSSYGCTVCSQVTLCLIPCFELFHSKLNYRQLALENRISEILYS